MVNEDNFKHVPLGVVISATDLSGWLNKYLDVPQGRLGIVYSSDNSIKTFQPGRHLIHQLKDRIIKPKEAVICGYVPGGKFSISIIAPYLTTRDGLMVDLELICRVTLNHAEKFFTKEVIPLGEISGEPLELEGDAARKVFNTLASQHYWMDLVREFSIDRLIEILFPALPRFLNDRGMELVSVDVVSFNKSEQRFDTKQKVQSIKEEVKKLEGTPQGESQQNFLGRIHKILPEGLRVRKDTKDDDLLDQLLHLTPEDGRKDRNPHRGLWERSFGIIRDEKSEEYKWLPKFWWLGRAFWILLLLGMGAGLTYIAVRFAKEMDSGELWRFVLIGVWGVIIPLILDSLRKLIEKREKLAEVRWLAPGSIYLYDLVHNNRNQADQLVRKHCSDELAKAVDVLHDLRSRIYKTGDNERALNLRRLERKLGDSIDQIRSQKFGEAAYLNNLNISNKAWHLMLDYDEDLMLFANAIFDHSALAQLAYPDRELDEAKMNQLERQLDLFMAKFAARSRVVKA